VLFFLGRNNSGAGAGDGVMHAVVGLWPPAGGRTAEDATSSSSLVPWFGPAPAETPPALEALGS